MHSSDWLPTLTHLAGISIPKRASLDGKNMWEALSKQTLSPRHEVVHNIDPIYPYTSYLLAFWKYVNGTINPMYDTWMGELPTGENPQADRYPEEVYASAAWRAVSKHRPQIATSLEVLREQSKIVCDKPRGNMSSEFICDPLKSPCLFFILTDPCEQTNLASTLPNMLRIVERSLAIAKLKVVEPQNKPHDARADPALNGYQWTYWLDLIDENSNIV